MRRWLVICLACLSWATASDAQQNDATATTLRSPILTVDPGRLLRATVIGQRLAQALEDESRALDAENQRIVAELRAEELLLTEQRPTMERTEFAALAEEFDQRVQAARLAQDAKQTALEQKAAEQERALLREIQPVLAQIMVDTGAAVIVESGSVLLSARSVDVTDLAIARINASFQDDADTSDN